MGILRLRLLYRGQDEAAGYFPTLFDSGATHSFVRLDVVEKLHLPIQKSNFPMAETAVPGSELKILGYAGLEFVVGNQILLDLFFVTEHLTEEVIIGAETMQKFRVRLDFEHDEVYVAPSVNRIHII